MSMGTQNQVQGMHILSTPWVGLEGAVQAQHEPFSSMLIETVHFSELSQEH